MLFADIGMIDEDFSFRAHRYVGIVGDKISFVGDRMPEEDFGPRYEGCGKVLLPGLVNAHAHAPMTLLRGYAENLPLDRWLNEKVFPFEARIDASRAHAATLLAIAEMARFGIVSFSDMYYHSPARCQAVLESGIKANICDTVIDFAGTSYRDADISQANDRLIEEYHGAGEGRLRIDLGLHAEYTSTPLMVETFAQEAKARGLNVHVHVSETAREVAECKVRHDGMTPPAYLASLGLFDAPTTAAHCVWLEGDDIGILASHGVTVALNPASNAKLGSGIADEGALRSAGVKLALGTDGVASNNNHNMFKDMYLLALLSRAKHCDPVGIEPAEVLRAATLNGACAQGRFDTGVIAEGKRADLCVLNVDTPWMQPMSDAVTGIIYSAQGSDVCLTMADGVVIYRDGVFPTIDVERAQAETVAARAAILSEL